MSAQLLPREIQDLARELLVENGADPESPRTTAQAAQRVLKRFHERLVTLVGEGGFRSLLELAHSRAVRVHPVLEGWMIHPTANPYLEETEGFDAAGEAQAQELADGLSVLVGEVLLLLRNLGREQDWSVAELWPGLKALREAGLSFSSEPVGKRQRDT